ncbi:putative spore coat protein regulator protein RsfA [Alkalihalophilus pseudofirmus OF4]|uniref:Spore coat protein regulator protein RsfA n=1 Tax=Alkalihalophilus pseudofirmus (strain ATCC BAA-2126 / JCM 17055 / OF4) TaxID=398511 RepID=D3FVY1_ALKPO|nr:RsfA family transcriptional regulator [Alkalihalophilus pseudofirmus]ADC50413.1 putative spore coat protein regulator protein RsfA [Alkalihalophilus pseudofirmus OF4]
MKVRQDAWSHEDDVLLAETVLKHIREGSTQLQAFEEVGDELNRTSAACGFRWNAVVRQRFIKQIAEAKKERKQRKRAMSFSYYTQRKPLWAPPAAQPLMNAVSSYNPEQPASSSSLSLDAVIQYLQTLSDQTNSKEVEEENQALIKTNLELINRNRELEIEIQKLKQDSSIIEEDYQSLIQIMNRARRMAILEDEESLSNASFKMDKNGNLEKLAK